MQKIQPSSELDFSGVFTATGVSGNCNSTGSGGVHGSWSWKHCLVDPTSDLPFLPDPLKTARREKRVAAQADSHTLNQPRTPRILLR